ncbi:DUF3892 domain-containing protein [Cytobacillus dafuensis]|uniref:DUF3892 domain-containing protein n=1 Tax=Cytobacillus dafuensis TaxID=1742359 RepID=A0A5B8Z7X8_CYTDA|nr:DUF3892 domain-containing protein [Cytobacillus dafuensis]QED48353.1 DUF3892 domain-containing protein [Cytobacillus dafuensis]
MLNEQLIAVYRNYHGDIISFKTSSGRIISYQKALQEAENGIITGVNIVEGTDEQPLILIPMTNSSFDDLPNMY